MEIFHPVGKLIIEFACAAFNFALLPTTNIIDGIENFVRRIVNHNCCWVPFDFIEG